MFKRGRTLLGLLLIVAVSGCVSQEEFDDLREDHEQLKADHNTAMRMLNSWSQDVFKWQVETYREICGIPASDSIPSGLERGESYCPDTIPQEQQGGGGEPDEPPTWGTDEGDVRAPGAAN